VLAAIAKEFSPRYEQHRAGDLVSIDVSGLERLLGPPRTIGQELVREAAARTLHPHVALAATQTTGMLTAIARPGLTVVSRGGEAAALAAIPIDVLEHFTDHDDHRAADSPLVVVSTLKHWGLRTLGELAALPADDLAARLGRPGRIWQAMARGEDIRPLVPVLPEERFDASLELEWPIDGLEPLSFVLTRLLEPLSTRLEQRDRGAAVLHVQLRLVTKEAHARRLELPSPIRDVRTLRTLALLDLESHPPEAAVDGVTVTIDPTPGRVLQHTLFTRPHPTPDQLSTLLARLGALMGHDRVGAAATVDSYRPGAFEMKAFATEHRASGSRLPASGLKPGCESLKRDGPAPSPQPLASALCRCRQPVPARVAVDGDRPVRVTTDRRGFAGGAVTRSVGPWRTSGNWWEERLHKNWLASSWNRDEWDVALSDGAVYRIFRDRDTNAWFIDAIVD
jgi:protein ImuB